MIQTYSKEQYEKTRPANEVKIQVNGANETYIVRAYVDRDNTLHVLAHRTDEKGNECLPLAYMLGRNSLMMNRKK